MSKYTAEYIANLRQLKSGELGILRTLQYCPLDESLEGFDLFTGIWWPLRAKNKYAPKREIAWLIAKLYARYRLDQEDKEELPSLLGRVCYTLRDEKKEQRFINKYDLLLSSDPKQLEYHLSWALSMLMEHRVSTVDWVKLTDDISIWDRESTRNAWVQKFYENNKKTTYSGGKNAY